MQQFLLLKHNLVYMFFFLRAQNNFMLNEPIIFFIYLIEPFTQGRYDLSCILLLVISIVKVDEPFYVAKYISMSVLHITHIGGCMDKSLLNKSSCHVRVQYLWKVFSTLHDILNIFLCAHRTITKLQKNIFFQQCFKDRYKMLNLVSYQKYFANYDASWTPYNVIRQFWMILISIYHCCHQLCHFMKKKTFFFKYLHTYLFQFEFYFSFFHFSFIFPKQFFIEDYKMHRQKNPYKTTDLTLSFGQFINPRTVTVANPFQRVKSEMLKRRQRLAIRKKPMEYAKLQLSLQDKLKQKSFNADEQRDQLIMLEKCKNYFQLRRQKTGNDTAATLTPKNSIYQPKKRPQTSNISGRNSMFLDKLTRVMNDCTVQDKEECQMKENMGLFTFYCKMMDKRLEGIKNNIEKKERMI